MKTIMSTITKGRGLYVGILGSALGLLGVTAHAAAPTSVGYDTLFEAANITTALTAAGTDVVTAAVSFAGLNYAVMWIRRLLH